MLTEGVKQTVLANGLTVITKEVHEAPVATVFTWYKVGGRNERPGITGISHWVEHMLFKGGKEFAKREIARSVTRAGGVWNGFTQDDFTTYFETLPSSALDLGLQIERDRMCDALFDPAEVASERTVIISEREGAENSPGMWLWEQVLGTAFTAHPYRYGVIGYKSDLRAITREDLYSYYKSHYAPNNCSLVIVGDFDTAQLLKRVEELFGDVKERVEVPPVRTDEPPQQGERRVLVKRPGTASYIHIAYHIPQVLHEGIYPLMLLNTVLSGSAAGQFGMRLFGHRTSRLYRALVRTGLATSAGCQTMRSIDPGLMYFSAAARNGVEIKQVEDALLTEVQRAQEELVSEEELAKARRQFDRALRESLDGVTGTAMLLGFAVTCASLKMLEELPANMAAVTAERMREVAQRYLGADNRTVGWFIPTGSPYAGAQGGAGAFHLLGSPVAFATGFPRGFHVPFEKQVLPNGVTAIVAPRPSAGAVAIEGSVGAGSVDDPPEKDGLAVFCAAAAQRGTKRRTFDQLFEAIDSVGASFSMGAGLHRTAFSGKCAPADLPMLLEAASEVLREPSFPEQEVEKVRGEILTRLRHEDDDTREIAVRECERLLYGEDHPYGRRHSGKPEVVEKVSAEELAAFHAAEYSPGECIVVVAGPVEPEEAMKLIVGTFAGWERKGMSEQPAVPRPSLPGPQRTVITMHNKTQCDIAWACAGLPRNHPDYYALEQATQILGGLGMMGRLGENVRDDQGLAYYCYARQTAEPGPYLWLIHAGVNPANVDRALETFRTEIARLRQEPVSDREYGDVKSYLTGVVPLRLERVDGLVSILHGMEFHRLGDDFLERYPEIVQSISKEDIQRAAESYITQDAYSLAIVGPYVEK